MQPGVVDSEVSRRHDLTPQQLFAWRHDAKQGRLALPEEAMSFVPVVAAADEAGSSARPQAPAMRQIEIHLGTAVIKAPEDMQAKHLTRVLRSVKAAL